MTLSTAHSPIPSGAPRSFFIALCCYFLSSLRGGLHRSAGSFFFPRCRDFGGSGGVVGQAMVGHLLPGGRQRIDVYIGLVFGMARLSRPIRGWLLAAG